MGVGQDGGWKVEGAEAEGWLGRPGREMAGAGGPGAGGGVFCGQQRLRG